MFTIHLLAACQEVSRAHADISPQSFCLHILHPFVVDLNSSKCILFVILLDKMEACLRLFVASFHVFIFTFAIDLVEHITILTNQET